MKLRKRKVATRCFATWVDRNLSNFLMNFLYISGTLVDRYKHTRRHPTEE